MPVDEGQSDLIHVSQVEKALGPVMAFVRELAEMEANPKSGYMPLDVWEIRDRARKLVKKVSR